MNALGYLAIIALIVLVAWFIHDVRLLILYKRVEDKETKKIMENNDADGEGGEDI